ncbi:MAG: hypothetical protein HKN22_04405 [Bacteroidia bacterium]|nr:hypothetical protein [Bacteroidia bacterium]
MKGSNKIDRLFRDKLLQKNVVFKDEYWSKFKEDFLLPNANTPVPPSSGSAGLLGSTVAKLIIAGVLTATIASLMYFQFVSSSAGNLTDKISIKDPVTTAVDKKRNIKGNVTEDYNEDAVTRYNSFSRSFEGNSIHAAEILSDLNTAKIEGNTPAGFIWEQNSNRSKLNIENTSFNQRSVTLVSDNIGNDIGQSNDQIIADKDRSEVLSVHHNPGSDFTDRDTEVLMVYSENVSESSTVDRPWLTSRFDPIHLKYGPGEKASLVKAPFGKSKPIDKYIPPDRIFFGLSVGMDLTFSSLVYDEYTPIESATAERRKQEEQHLVRPSIEMEVGYFITPNLILSSGVNYYTYGTKARYTSDPLTFTTIENQTHYQLEDNGGYLIYTDSFFTSSPSPQYVYTGYRWIENWDTTYTHTTDTVEHTTSLEARDHINRIKYLEIPLNISYLKHFRRMYVRGQFGLGLGLIVRSSVNTISPDFQAEQYRINTADDYRDILLNVNSSFEFGYRIHHSTFITTAIRYKHALHEAENSQDGVKRRYSNIGARAGVSFHF